MGSAIYPKGGAFEASFTTFPSSAYMILDDHEIEDNWVQGRLKDALKRDLFQNAIRAYMSYQWVHGPRNFDRSMLVVRSYSRKGQPLGLPHELKLAAG